MFGLHMMVDCVEADPVKTGDVELVRKFLTDLPGRVGMRAITSPEIYEVKVEDHEEPGVTGLVVLYTSHASYHQFTEKNCFFFDLFSCSEYNPAEVLVFLHEVFGEFKVEKFKSEKRGKSYTRHG